MTEFNPFAGSLLSSTQTQRQMAVDKQRQVRRAQSIAKDIAAGEDRFEHQVESAEEVNAIHDDEAGRKQQQAKQQSAEDEQKPELEDEPPRLDLKA